MDNIQRWLKSLRLHKYQPLFKALTYEEMLNLDENYLIERQVTKGARNKILVSVRKLNMRQDRLIHLIDDINQGNLSMKEALTVLNEMLITPIPQPSSSPLLSSASSSTSGCCSDSDAISVSSMGSLTSTAGSSPHHLTYLFVDTLEKVARQLIESPDYEDAACHGIMATIVDECLKHNSFTKEQKARVARFRQPHNRQYHRHPLQRRQLPQALGRQCHWHPFQRRQQSQLSSTQYYWHSLKHQQQPQQQQQQQQQHQTHQYPHQQSNYKEYSLLSPCLTFELPCLRARMSSST